tara:strand:+ start:2914 stop:3432 length:519 start_codon:yes stop_codon:yes gene_type:complete
MKNFLFIFCCVLFISCSKPKTVLICGDHVCINKAEANQYFEENLSIEVKIVDKKVKKKANLVELNLKENLEGNREILISSKDNLNENIKILSKKEISTIKKNIKNKQIKKKIVRKKSKPEKKRTILKDVNKNRKEVVDVCTILKKCSIDEISKYLLKEGKKRDFPDITERQL